MKHDQSACQITQPWPTVVNALQIHVLQQVVDADKGGPLHGIPLPTAAHQGVHVARATGRTYHAHATLQHLVHLGQLDAGVRRQAVRDNLPQEHAERWEGGGGKGTLDKK